MFLELFGRDVAPSTGGELGTDELLHGAKPQERIRRVFFSQDVSGVGARVRLELVEELFILSKEI